MIIIRSFLFVKLQDFFAVELYEGHLYVQLDLGSGAKKIRPSKYELNDSNWHRVDITLRKRTGRVTIDEHSEPFETPGTEHHVMHFSGQHKLQRKFLEGIESFLKVKNFLDTVSFSLEFYEPESVITLFCLWCMYFSV